MKNTLLLTLAGVLLSFGLTAAPALERSALSAAAQELIPPGHIAVIVLKDGSRIQGTLTHETEAELQLRVQQSENIFVGRRVSRDDIASVHSADVAPLLAERLLAIPPEPEISADLETYRKILALFDEFLEKAKGAEAYEAIRERRAIFHADQARVLAGMEKVDGSWLPPVAASVKNFELASRAIHALEQRPEFRTQPELQDEHTALVDKRRDIARRAPQLMAERLQPLLNAHNFAEAAFETTALLHFWVDQVVTSEGPARAVLGQMDFAFILRMFERIMDNYRRAGRGTADPTADSYPPDRVYIPGGYFLMGEKTDDPQRDTFPMRLVYVSPFLIDRYEVSNADYRRFVNHVEATGESWFEHPDAPPLKKHSARGWEHAQLRGDRQPVVGVDWFDAFAYARWVLGREHVEQGRMKRLPTEAEWEKAARFTDARTYPWGEESPARSAVNWPEFRSQVGQEMDRQNPPVAPEPPRSLFGCVRKKDIPPPPPTVIPAETWDVDRLLPALALEAEAEGVFRPPWKTRDVSAYGVYHMAGNAAEWVQDAYDPQTYRTAPIKDPQGPGRGGRRVFRGGSYLSDIHTLSTAWRGHPRGAAEAAGCRETGGHSQSFGMPFIGFRCAQSLYLVKTEDADRQAQTDLSFEALMQQLRAADEKHEGQPPFPE